MPSLRSRKSPKQDAIEHALMGLDKTVELEKKYINSFKGRGVFTKAPFRKEDFVVEYRGELIDWDESQKRKMDYGTGRVFVFDFRWQEKTWCVDAAKEDDSLGRLVNDDHKHPNCKMKMIVTEGKPHLCLFALRDLDVGEEITYDYGPADWPWRKKDKGQSTVTKTAEREISKTREQPPRSKDSDMEY
ncbi:N-lysine methyltransferase KMT5A-A-like [Corythoichthys intestinalis]|uniref:N-lysine methyltransferase KMT5A-A-like n=1 Tax=Corythoichthys intestinalis TaxID=161448 RepID=UPI0025A5E562|nr:N-lysine methyltransferase KMT5A-A-like [Corythoichthys intestinalis]